MSWLPSHTGSPWASCRHYDYLADADTEAAVPVVARTHAANATTSTSPAVPSGPISCHKASRRRIGVVGLALALVMSGLASLAASAAPASAATNQVVATVEVGSGPAEIAFNPANGNFYVTNFFDDEDGDGRGTVQVINGSTNQVVTTFEVGMLPVGVAFNSVNRHLYVANSGDHTVSVINGSTNTLVATIPVGVEPYGVASANGYVYVTNRKDATLSVINGSTNQVVSTVGVGRAYEPGITFGSMPTAVAFNPINGYLYVALTGDNGVRVIDSATNGWVTGVGVGRRPSAVAYNRSNGNIYVANGQDATVSVISGSTHQVTDTVPLGVTAGDEGSLVHKHGIAYNSANGNVYVANRAANSVSVINGSNNQVIDTVAVGKAPTAVAFDSVDGDAYVANFGLMGEHDHDTVSVILNTSQAVIFTSTAPPHPTVGGTYTATAVGGPSGNPVVFSVDSASTPGACTVSSAGAVAFTGAGSCVINANQAGNTRYSAARQGQQSLTVVGFQNVTFTSSPPPNPKVGGAYTATASGGASGNPVVFSSDSTSTSDACSVSAAGAVAFTGEGSCVINANQAGDAIYFAAPQAQQTLSIAAGLPIQRITFSSTPPPDPKVLGAYTATATGGASGNPVVFSSDSTSTPGACTVSGTGAVAFTAVGSCVINANQAGNDTYAVAPQVQQTLDITKSSQTITFTSTPPPGAAVGGTYKVTATGGASGNTVIVYPSPPPSSNGVCELRGVREIYFIGVGTCGIAAVQSGNAAYDAAPVARQSFAVAGQSRTQTIAFTSAAPPSPTVGGTYTATASGGPSGNPVVFSVDASSSPGACTVSSAGAVAFTGVGSCVITADQAGNDDFTAAPTATQVVAVSKASQTIDFPDPGPKSLGDPPFTVSATASSGLPVTFTVASGPCTLAGSTVTLTGVGTCVIAADQAGNNAFSAAPQITRSVAVAKSGQTITFTDPGPHTFGDAPFTVSATASSGLPVTFTVASGPCTIAGSTVTITGVGTCVIAADQAGNTDFSAAPQVTRSVAVAKSGQTITFTDPGPHTFGDAPFTASATATSGLPVAFTVASGPCTIAGTTVTITGVGTCVIAADQGGNTDFSAAPRVTRDVAVSRAALTITASDARSTYGQAPPSVTPGYSGFVNGDGPSALSTGPTCGVGASATSPPGTYATSCSGAAAANYAIAYVNGTLTVDKVPLTITASDARSTYGQAPPAVTPSYSGFVNGDGPSALSTAPTCGVGASATSPAGTYATSCSGAAAANYAIAYVNGTLTVDKAPLTISASDATSSYGDTPPAITPRYGGFVNGDGPAALSVVPTCTPGGSSTTPAGTYPGATSCSGAAAASYAISYVNGTLTVDKRPLDLTATDTSKVYGQDVPPLAATLSGFVNGDPATVVTGAATLTTTATATSRVGTYPIMATPGTLSAANYTFTPHAGTLTVTPAPLTVTASSTTMVLKGTPPTITANFTGLVGGDTSASEQAKATCSTTATTESPLGTYPTTCTLADANYSPTYVAGTLQVTYGIKVVHDQTAANRSGSNVPVKVQLVDATGKNLSSSTIVVTLGAPALSPSPNPGAQPTGTFTFLQTKDNGPMYQFDVKTSGFPKGTYTLTFMVAGDPAAHTAQLVIG